MAKILYLNNFECPFIDAVKDVPTTGTPATELNYGILRLNNTASGVLVNPNGGDYYLLTAFKRSGGAESAFEVIKVTEVDITTYPGECRIKVDRAQEGTSAKAYVTGDLVQLRWTKGGAETMQQAGDKDASGGIPGLTLLKLNLRNALNTVTSWFTTAATAARTWTMPDKDGTVAMTSDITGGSVAASFSSVQSSGSISVTGVSSVIGYGAGAGITVTQPTSKTTPVTANRGSGEITMYAADQIQSFAYVTFRLNNTLIDQNTLVSVSLTYTDNFSIYEAWVSTTRPGFCHICVRNNDVVPNAYAVKILFTLSKVATS